MKKLSWLLVLAMVLLPLCAVTASAEGTYTQAPMFDALVESGELPPVEERLPENPCLIHEFLDEYLDPEIGNFGGTLRFVTNSVNWDADVFVGMTEGLLTMQSSNSDQVDPNIVESYEVNEDNTVFTFKLRKGLKWSDGTEVTMEDFRFAIENFVFNEELTPVIAAWMRDAGTAAGDPFTFEIIDDETFTLSFKESYGGFVVHLSIAGWKGYTEILKPAHFLKQFHKDFAEECHGSLDAYYEFMQPYATFMGYDDVKEEGIWCYIFNQMDCTNWECTDPNDAMPSYYFGDLVDCDSFPQLYPWIMTECADGKMTTWTRNPYYFCVDEAGNQMPYFDKLTSAYVESAELVQFNAMSGDVDFMREAATINNISLYRENAETAGITAYTTSMHNNPGDIMINFNYGLNADGTVKDDDHSKAWQEMVNDHRFLQALMISIDAQELADAVFNGFAEPNEYFACTGDHEGAIALLDEMGAVDIDGDGFRETPSGLPFAFNISVGTSGSLTDVVACDELYREYWTAIGLNCQVAATDDTLLSTSRQANEIEMVTSWLHTNALWHYQEWYINEPLWQKWIDAGGLTGTLKSDDTYLEPSEEFKQFVLGIQGCFTVDPVTAVNENVPMLMKMQAENLWDIEPLQHVQQCVVINSDVRNVPSGGIGISWNFGIEQMFYENPDQH